MTVTVTKPQFNVRDELNSAKGLYKNAWGPAFIAYVASSQSISANSWNKLTYNGESVDTHNCFSSGRFTPTVAGLYQVNATVRFAEATTGYNGVSIYKNGAPMPAGYLALNNFSQGGNTGLGGSTLVYLNGSSDYIEVYVYSNATNPTVSSDTTASGFSAYFVRGV